MAVYRRVICPSWPSRRKPDDGFTLIEVLIAMGAIFTALLVMAFIMLSAFKSVGFSRQRTQATSLANQALEQIRALPADALFLSSADTATDPNLTPSGCLATLSCTFAGRIVPVANYGVPVPITPPLVPSHVSTAPSSPGSTTYTVRSYLTIDPLDPQIRIVTVQASWTNPQQGGVSPTVQVESKLHTSPFTQTSPLVHTYTATAYDSPGTIGITGDLLGTTGINMAFPLPAANAYLAGGIPGTNVGVLGGAPPTAVEGAVGGAGLQSALVPLDQTQPVLADASTLAGSTVPNGPIQRTAAPKLLSLPASAGVGVALISGNLTGQAAVGAVNEADAVAASQATSSMAGLPIGQFLPNSKLGFGRAMATQSGAISSSLSLLGGAVNLPIVSATPTGNNQPDVATVAEAVSGPTTSYTATADKYFSQLDVLTLPLTTNPVLRLTSFHGSASACASGPGGTCTPSVATSVGTLQILGGTPFSLQSRGAGTYGIPTTTALNILNLFNFTVSGSFTIGSNTPTSPGSAVVTSPLVVNLTVDIATAAGHVSTLAVKVDLGSLSTSAQYT